MAARLLTSTKLTEQERDGVRRWTESPDWKALNEARSLCQRLLTEVERAETERDGLREEVAQAGAWAEP